MDNYLRTFFIMSFLLFIFTVNGIARQMPFEVAENDTCFITLYPEHANRFSSKSLEVDLHYDHLSPIHGTEAPLADNTIRLELTFRLQLQQYNYGRAMPIQISSVTESRKFQGYFSMPFFGISEGTTVIDVIREAIRKGYRGVRDALGTQLCFKRSLVNVIRAIEGDRIQIPLGQLDSVRVGDISHIYPGEYEYYNSLIDMPYLATGIVIKVDDTLSTLEVYVNRIGEIQVGDIVAPDPSIDFASRGLEQRDEPYLEILQMGRVPRIFVRFVDNNGVRVREEITSYIRQFLIEEAPSFGFQVEVQ